MQTEQTICGIFGRGQTHTEEKHAGVEPGQPQQSLIIVIAQHKQQPQ